MNTAGIFSTSLLDSNERLNFIFSCDWRVFFINILGVRSSTRWAQS
jgi:hypothetical protein